MLMLPYMHEGMQQNIYVTSHTWRVNLVTSHTYIQSTPGQSVCFEYARHTGAIARCVECVPGKTGRGPGGCRGRRARWLPVLLAVRVGARVQGKAYQKGTFLGGVVEASTRRAAPASCCPRFLCSICVFPGSRRCPTHLSSVSPRTLFLRYNQRRAVGKFTERARARARERERERETTHTYTHTHSHADNLWRY
jgi:hypothetical protein